MEKCIIDDVYLQKMKLHATIKLEDGTLIKKVPRGWIYNQYHWDSRTGNTSHFQVTSVFVPNS